MPSTFGNRAKKLPVEHTPDEPSMDEILASIREIISEDEAADNAGQDERARYTHPTDVSNTNKAAPSASVAPQTPARPSAPASPVAAKVPLESSSPRTSLANQELSATLKNIEDRAAKIRADLGFNKSEATATETRDDVEPVAAGSKLKLEQLAEARRTPSMQFTSPVPIPRQPSKSSQPAPSKPVQTPAAPMQTESEALRPTMTPHAAAPKAPETPRYTPAPKPEFTPNPQQPGPATAELGSTFDQIAANLLEEKSEDLEAMLGDMMRPVVRKWLGENLPTLVERLVREEIEKVSKGRK